MRAVPESIGQLTNLTELDLGRNGLTVLPEWIGQLTNLTRLNLGGNRLTVLPEWIGQLTDLTDLDLGYNGLTVLPESIGQLTNLTELNLRGNGLTVLPEWIGQLTNLTGLNLGGNRLTVLPEWIGQLTDLTDLDLALNGLTTLPESIGQLTNLTELKLAVVNLYGNVLTVLPEWIGQLTDLTELDLSYNGLTTLPEWIGQLTNLTKLDLRRNGLTTLPESIGQLTNLTDLDLTGNPLVYPPAAVASQGSAAVLAFLRAGQTGSQRQWGSKLLIVGEGGAGKTTLLKVLTGAPADPREPTTHGLNIQDLPMAHPTEAGVTMRLSAWDFGGQDIYHATHQFFLTDQSLFLLVWSARAGWEQSRGRYWLDIVNARTRTDGRQAAPVVLVATHARHRAPDLPLTELRAQYPNIVASVQVDSLAGPDSGIDELRQAIAEAATGLPLMGASWPDTWTAARAAVRESDRNRMGTEAFADLLTAAGVADPAGQQALTGTLHRLGEILHYDQDPELSGTVVLKPAWLSKRIAAILDCEPVAERHGLLLAQDIAREWPDVGAELQRQLLFMMDRYEVSYRITDTGDDARAVVVDRLPWEPPDYRRDWDALLDTPGHRELQLHYTIASSVPPGIPGWFIAHAHRFATTGHRPWRTGTLLAHPDGRHLGLLRFDAHTRTVQLAVRGPRPAGFLGLLDLDFVQATLHRYPGLPITRTVPCPCRPACPTAFPFDTLTRLHDAGQSNVQCYDSGRLLDLGALIDGIAPARSDNDDPAHIAATVARIEAAVLHTNALVQNQGEVLREDAELRHLEFARLMSWLQTDTPTVFTITEKPRRAPGVHRYILRLYCAEPNAVHQLPDDEGCYRLTALDPWAGALARHLTTIATLLSVVTGLTNSVLGHTAPELLKRNSEDLKKVHQTLDHLKAGSTAVAARLTTGQIPTDRTNTEADLRAIAELLTTLDPHRRWGGLSKTLTPGGLTLYLCRDHAQGYNNATPRPHGL